jgi:SAM-dependent methyltransferase
MNRVFHPVLVVFLLMVPVGNALPQEAPTFPMEGLEYDVPYVPTPQDVVEQMLRMASVGPADLVYDLGCGDGRIVITAVRELGARGVGIDIDPRRIEQSRRNAREAGVEDRVRFYEMDLFDANIHEATAVTLYLLPDVNLRLRPKLLRELRPGTRVVSHDYHMGEWRPDQTEQIRNHRLYAWVVPGNVSGVWRGSIATASGEVPVQLDLAQRFQQVAGYLTTGSSGHRLADTVLVGQRLLFTAERIGGSRNEILRFEGRVEGDALDGTLELPEGPVRWRATRDPRTASSLDGEPHS